MHTEFHHSPITFLTWFSAIHWIYCPFPHSISGSSNEGRSLKGLQLWGAERRWSEYRQGSAKGLGIYGALLLGSWGTFQAFLTFCYQRTPTEALGMLPRIL